MEIPRGRIDIEALRKEYAETQPLVESSREPRDAYILDGIFGDTYERLGENEFPKQNGLGSIRMYRGFIRGEMVQGRDYVAVLLDTDGDTYTFEPDDVELEVDFLYFPMRDVRDEWGNGNELTGLLALARDFTMLDVPGPGPCPLREQDSALNEIFLKMEQNSFDSPEPHLTVYYRNIFAAQIVKHRQKLQEEATTEE